ncbi:Hypothetical predicted protein [Cloeon dipterum]|uniref:methylenetetrahydrofolate reductase (NADPH) n=4 Tax=Cloeon dipterum TaxID=197152 RepID=A0A8S1DPM3_9INSE|nr:Hypothetical predicted protein [Cloeon dipterum]
MVKQTLLSVALADTAHSECHDDPEERSARAVHSCDGCHPPLAESVRRRVASGDLFFSLEFFPPRTRAGAANLLSRFDRVKAGGALFCAITWHPAGDPGGHSETSSLTIAGSSFNYCGLETMLHIAATNLTKQDVLRYLNRAKSMGVRAILALRGDKPKDYKVPEDGFEHAVDLVRTIRANFGSYFTIAVGGYPEGHPEAISYHQDLFYLKEKVEAGADLVLSQMFFHAQQFIDFQRDCRNVGITVPIIPGVMPIQSFASLRQMVKLSGLQVPESIQKAVEPIKDNDEAVQNFGIHFALQLVRTVLDAKAAPGVHFFTLNREHGAVEIGKRLGVWQTRPARPLPWRLGDNHRRCLEQVRPIFWASRPRAYVHRTQHWDDFPNGRWGKHDSPAFGTLADYYLFYLNSQVPPDQLRAMWLSGLNEESDVWHVFYSYVSHTENKQGVKVTRLPWNDGELNAESAPLLKHLARLNSRGILTINSQPNVNGTSSSDPVVGWGAPDGYVYQKAYLEFFARPEVIYALLEELKNYPLVNYHIVNKTGEKAYTNTLKKVPIAVTWGVFPGREIIQPTVVDPVSFNVWKDEAFALWGEQWGRLYNPESQSRKVLARIENDYSLVNLVDNEFPHPTCLWTLLEKTLERVNGL